MPRGRLRKNIIEVDKKESETIIVKEKLEQKEKKKSNKEEILSKAKDIDLFKYNKMYKQYEIIISVNEYEKI